MQIKEKDIFGKLTVMQRVDSSKNKHIKWLCKCKCGNESVVFASNLRRKHTKSCGCDKINLKHGLVSSPIYSCWQAMLQRCNNPNNKNYKNYGGRGIAVCKRWFLFKNFHSDMFHSFKKGLTIDRIDNNGNYTIKNCKWSTKSEQNNNMRTNRTLIYEGELMSAKELSQKINRSYSSIIKRVNRGTLLKIGASLQH